MFEAKAKLSPSASAPMHSLFVINPDRWSIAPDKAKSGVGGALVFDLPSSHDKAAARRDVRDLLRTAHSHLPPACLVAGLHSIDDPDIEADLDFVVASAPFAVLLPSVTSGADIQRLGAKIAVREAECGAPDGAVKILAVAGGTSASLFKLSTLDGASRRLRGLIWSPTALAADLGCAPDEASEPLRVARSLVLFAAAAAGVPAFEDARICGGDGERLRNVARRAKSEGFSGLLIDRVEGADLAAELFHQQ